MKKPNWYAITSLIIGGLTLAIPLIMGINGCQQDRVEEVSVSNMIEQRISYPEGFDGEIVIDKEITIKKRATNE